LRITSGYCRQCRPGTPQSRPAIASEFPAFSESAIQEAASHGLVPVIIPPLVATLFLLERKKGAPLTEEEVYEIRDKAPAMMLPIPQAEQLEKARGYRDINPESCWSEWLQRREDA